MPEAPIGSALATTVVGDGPAVVIIDEARAQRGAEEAATRLQARGGRFIRSSFRGRELTEGVTGRIRTLAPTRVGARRKRITLTASLEGTRGSFTSICLALTQRTSRPLAPIGVSAQRGRRALGPCRLTLARKVGGTPTKLMRGLVKINGRPSGRVLGLATLNGDGEAAHRVVAGTTALRGRLKGLLKVDRNGIKGKVSRLFTRRREPGVRT